MCKVTPLDRIVDISKKCIDFIPSQEVGDELEASLRDVCPNDSSYSRVVGLIHQYMNIKIQLELGNQLRISRLQDQEAIEQLRAARSPDSILGRAIEGSLVDTRIEDSSVAPSTENQSGPTVMQESSNEIMERSSSASALSSVTQSMNQL